MLRYRIPSEGFRNYFQKRTFAKKSKRREEFEFAHGISRLHSIFFSVACTILIPFGAILYYKNTKKDRGSESQELLYSKEHTETQRLDTEDGKTDTDGKPVNSSSVVIRRAES